MPRDDNSQVWVPTFADDTCNLTEEGCEDMVRYSITSGELQREMVSWIKEIQDAGMDGRYYGESLDDQSIERHLARLAVLASRLGREAQVCNSTYGAHG